MIFLVDTCVLSEATKPQKHGGVMSWLTHVSSTQQYVSALTIGELHYGAERLPKGRKQNELRSWVRTVVEDYAGRVVPFDEAIAVRWGQLRAHLPNLPTVDAQIAATAMTYNFTLVTRNVKDFVSIGLDILDPWRVGGAD